MLVEFLRGLLMLVMLALFLWTGHSSVMAASALCAGAIIGSELFALSWSGTAVFTILVSCFFDSFSVKGAAMMAPLAPEGMDKLVGLMAFFMMAIIGGYAFWELVRTRKVLKEGQADARR